MAARGDTLGPVCQQIIDGLRQHVTGFRLVLQEVQVAEDQAQVAVGHHVAVERAALEVLLGDDPGAQTQAPHHRTFAQRGGHRFGIQQSSARDELIQPQVQAALVGNRREHRVVFDDPTKRAAEGVEEIIGVLVQGFETTGAEQQHGGLPRAQ
jgi:hypothetical protein